MYKERLDNECGGFMEMLHNLHLNVLFLEAMAQIPRYAKYLKEFLIKKPILEGLANATLGEECSAFLLDRFPKKRSDPGSFTIPLDISDHHLDNALADLGASVNVMPYKLFKKLEVGELKTSKLSIILADRSDISSRGIVEDMMVRVGKFFYPTDFVILDISEDSDMPLILGRLFLATAKALIDVYEGTLILRDGKERIKLKIDPRVRIDEVKGLVSNDVNESGGEPPNANPTITCVVFDDVKKEVKKGPKSKGPRLNSWRRRMKGALTRKMGEPGARLVNQEGQLNEPKMGGYRPHPESVADPLSVASRMKS
ncbi:unnamed protein product [Linum trigynum]|uniref:Uncharacterized protein n=1 Tax=Linum trigynum TaxID=586398 RepID=A0AAV2DB44_9ROSI